MPSPYDLITAAELTDDWPQASSFSPTYQAALITRASRRVNTQCDRVLAAATYAEVHRPGRTRKVYTRQRPITAVSRVGTDLATVLTLQCQDPTCARTLAGFTSPGTPEDALAFTGLTLDEVRGTLTTPHTFLFTDYPTVGALATAVNALGNWEAVVSSNTTAGSQVNYAGWPTADLAPDVGGMGAQLLALEIKAYTRDVPYALDPELARRGVIELFEGRPDGHQYPDRRFIGGYGYGGLSGVTGGFDPRVGAVWVGYSAGYATADVPDDLKEAVILAARHFSGLRTGNLAMAGESYRDYSYTRRADSKIPLPPDVVDICERYARKEVF